jgi:hypothetical protein
MPRDAKGPSEELEAVRREHRAESLVASSSKGQEHRALITPQA